MRLKLIQLSLFSLWILVLSPAGATNEKILSPLPSQVTEKWNDFSLVGQTTLRRFGFHVYDSSFWLVGEKSGDLLNTKTRALSITYARKISAQQLLSSTKKEWQRLGFATRYPLDAWLTMLENIWPSVEKDDQLIVVVTKNGDTTFFNKNSSLGTISDSSFGPAFLSIWLDENSRFKKNRKELLGE
jgi:hypothetical protein